ncbi:MAG TPA: transcription termination/antitermination NusG family protein [Blastocatellia bacterium]|nr:transcription termination/antitermination NusG family protein [Blastocatellia bacterium]
MLIETEKLESFGGGSELSNGYDRTCWYVIHTHPRQEDRAGQNLRTLNIHSLTPKYREQYLHKLTGELCYQIKHLFPGYIFARFDPTQLYHKVRFTRGVHSIVSFDDKPAIVDDSVIAAIESRIREDGLVRLNEELTPGDQVEILSGPFTKFTGVFEWQMKDSERISILLQTVNYQAHVVLEKTRTRKLNPA